MSKLLQVLVIGTDRGVDLRIHRHRHGAGLPHHRRAERRPRRHRDPLRLHGPRDHQYPRQSYYVGIGGGIAVAGLLGLLFELLVVRRLPGQPDLQTAATLGLYVLLLGVVFTVPWWTDERLPGAPLAAAQQDVRVPGANQAVTCDQVVLLVALVLFSAGLYLMLRRTRIGLAMRAVSDDSDAAGLMGIRPEVVSRVAVDVGFGLSASHHHAARPDHAAGRQRPQPRSP